MEAACSSSNPTTCRLRPLNSLTRSFLYHCHTQFSPSENLPKDIYPITGLHEIKKMTQPTS
uniref:Uncharacterized protein n=1 Tax=Cucumis melo TaxID=3656 RepID=A0A9I9EDJ4_CUCME